MLYVPRRIDCNADFGQQGGPILRFRRARTRAAQRRFIPNLTSRWRRYASIRKCHFCSRYPSCPCLRRPRLKSGVFSRRLHMRCAANTTQTHTTYVRIYLVYACQVCKQSEHSVSHTGSKTVSDKPPNPPIRPPTGPTFSFNRPPTPTDNAF